MEAQLLTQSATRCSGLQKGCFLCLFSSSIERRQYELAAKRVQRSDLVRPPTQMLEHCAKVHRLKAGDVSNGKQVDSARVA